MEHTALHTQTLVVWVHRTLGGPARPPASRCASRIDRVWPGLDEVRIVPVDDLESRHHTPVAHHHSIAHSLRVAFHPWKPNLELTAGIERDDMMTARFWRLRTAGALERNDLEWNAEDLSYFLTEQAIRANLITRAPQSARARK